MLTPAQGQVECPLSIGGAPLYTNWVERQPIRMRQIRKPVPEQCRHGAKFQTAEEIILDFRVLQAQSFKMIIKIG